MATVSEEEKLYRRQSNASVIGTNAMEGLTLDPVSAEIGRLFDEGKLTLSEFSAAMQEHVSRLADKARDRSERHQQREVA